MVSKGKATAATDGERLPLAEAARFIGTDLSGHTLRSWARQGRIAYIRAGRRLFFDKNDLLDFIKRSRVSRPGGK